MGDKISIRVIDDDGESSTQLVETGIKLTVTPHVSGDNRILLDLHPENNSYDYDSKGEVVISTQEAKTKVVVADGETVVIGGLTRNETQESESGIPFLKDIPLFGNLFKYSRKSVVKKDLVIFVTPRIIRNYIGNVDISEVSAEKAAAPAAAPEAKKVEQKPAAQAKPAAAPAKQQTAAQPSQKPEASKAPAAPAPAKGDSDWE
jgi:type IV pilus assembly protein PilQ